MGVKSNEDELDGGRRARFAARHEPVSGVTRCPASSGGADTVTFANVSLRTEESSLLVNGASAYRSGAPAVDLTASSEKLTVARSRS